MNHFWSLVEICWVRMKIRITSRISFFIDTLKSHVCRVRIYKFNITDIWQVFSLLNIKSLFLLKCNYILCGYFSIIYNNNLVLLLLLSWKSWLIFPDIIAMKIVKNILALYKIKSNHVWFEVQLSGLWCMSFFLTNWNTS